MEYGDTVAQAGLLIAELRRRDVSVATAESLTAGRVQAAIASMPGASDVFRGGMTAYDLCRKVQLLKVDKSHARRHRCVSRRVALEMARGVRSHFDAELTISTTGWAAPDPPKVPAPMAWIAVDLVGEKPRATKVTLPKEVGRIEAQEAIARAALRYAVKLLDSR